MAEAASRRDDWSGPENFINSATGDLTLALVPLYLARLYPPEMKTDAYPCGTSKDTRFGTPLLKGAKLTEVNLKGGMEPMEVGGMLVFERAGDFWDESWYRWIAAAKTPFGWVEHPTPRFFRDPGAHEGREVLTSLSLAPSCHPTEESAEATLLQWALKALGAPTSEGQEPEWKFPWGKVVIGHDRDGWWPELVIMWEPFSTAALAHVRTKLRNIGSA